MNDFGGKGGDMHKQAVKQVITCTALLLLGTLVSGNEARIDGLGGYGIMPYICEELNMFDYPTDVLGFDSRILVEKGLTADCTWFGVIHKWKKLGLGLSVNREDYGTRTLGEFTYPAGSAKPSWLDYSSPLLPRNKLACVVGLKAFEQGFGLMISYAGAREQEVFGVHSSDTTSVTRESRSSGSYSVQAGLSVGILDLSAGYGDVRFKEEQEVVGGATREYASSDGTLRTVKLRAHIPVGSNLDIVPMASWRDFTLGESALSNVEGEDESPQFNYGVSPDSKFNLLAGIGSNLRFYEGKGLLIFGATVERYSLHIQHEAEADIQKVDYNAPRANMAVEVSPRTWLTVRGGMDKLFILHSTDTDYRDAHLSDGGETIWDEDNNIYFGTRLKFGNLQFDMTINQEYFYEGPYILTGNKVDLVNRISVNYFF
jgi:hypothetical protein